ncbi:distal tail protein Dit [Clostridium cagae]|uniref:distal tail protein Dit n=1 Tax=Clostridium cagae TaxID=2080751 RepID=UPI0013F0AFCB|nr:hypothetical protein [Clostridium botulinum]NFF37497.1 hypothetical protein [Clostridium botulinum]NFI49616.1 hypothetical protein [Clostridium botulinum]NFI58546.1 hypothetical protein [Clostridium botulinum]NFI69413.1 hypothetical protein [Clostridium botulinum]
MSRRIFNFYFNKENTEYMNFSIVKRYIPPIPKKRYKTYEVNGKDGIEYEDLGTYENIEINVDCNFKKSKKNWDWENEWVKQIEWITNWIADIRDNKLKFTDTFGYFYKVQKAEITNIERPLKNMCHFTITFTCNPFKFSDDGINFRLLRNNIEIRNPAYLSSKPVFEITGNGLCEIVCNENKVSIEVNEKAYIDCELGLCYDKNNNCINNKMKGYYEDLYYKTGINKYSWTQGFQILWKTNAIRL